MSDIATYYEILGVNESASMDEVRTAFVRLARQYHPDSIQLIPDHLDHIKRDAKERFEQISEAYAVLRNSEKRKEYDGLLKAERKDQRQKVDAPHG